MSILFNKLFVIALILFTLLTIFQVTAYTAPSNTAVDLLLTDTYTAPSNTVIPLVLDDTASSTTTCEITTDTTITSDLDCSGETFSVTNAATATVSAGITVQALKTNVNNGKINLKAGAKIQQGVS